MPARARNAVEESMKARTIRVIFLLMVSLSIGWALRADAQEDVRRVEDSFFQNQMRPAVTFVHDAHNEKAGIEECSTCHHVYEGGKLLPEESSEDRECSECHGAPGRDGHLRLAGVYHLRCRGCHQQQSAGPVQCSQCHRR